MKTITLDGSKITGLDTFYDETQLKLCPSFQGYGRNLDAFNDILHGGFGVFYEEKIKLVWLDSHKSQNALGYSETIKYLRERLPRVHPTNVERWQHRLDLAKKHQGPTLFDEIVGIIQAHKDIDLRLS